VNCSSGTGPSEQKPVNLEDVAGWVMKECTKELRLLSFEARVKLKGTIAAGMLRAIELAQSSDRPRAV